jgi:cytochrome c5
MACHTTGAAGAPKIGDAAIWNERSARGLDALVNAAINGVGAMPPRGGSQYDDDQMRAVVEYILGQSK